MDAKKSPGKDKEEILIVDESHIETERLRHILEQHGYHVSAARNGLEALVLMGKHKPMLVISDIVMQEMDCYQLCGQMRTDGNFKDVPIIFLTPLSDPIDIIKAVECGADNYIVKPYEEKYLLNQILYFLTRKVEREGAPSEMGMEIILQGKKYLINSDHLQILNLLISRYEKSEEKVWNLADSLQEMVDERTADLEEEVSNHKRTAGLVRESERRYRLLVENIPAVVFQGYADWTVDFFDDKIEDLIGYKKEEFDSRRMRWSDVVLREDLESLKKATEKALKLDKSYVREYRVRDNKGKIIWIQERSQINCDKDGKIEYISGVFYDITERKLAEEVLRESEEKYKTLAENSLTGVFIHQGGKFIFVNDKFAEDHGYTPEELLGKEYLTLIHPDEREAVTQIVSKRLARVPVTGRYEVRRLTKQGNTIWCEMMATGIEYRGRPAVMGNAIDITERKLAEEAIKESEHYYRSLLHSMHEDILVVDRDYRITDVNRTFLVTSGREREEVLGRHCYEVSHGYNEPCEKYGEECLLPEVFETGKPGSCRHQHTHVDGSKVWVDVLLSPLTDRGGTSRT